MFNITRFFPCSRTSPDTLSNIYTHLDDQKRVPFSFPEEGSASTSCSSGAAEGQGALSGRITLPCAIQTPLEKEVDHLLALARGWSDQLRSSAPQGAKKGVERAFVAWYQVRENAKTKSIKLIAQAGYQQRYVIAYHGQGHPLELYRIDKTVGKGSRKIFTEVSGVAREHLGHRTSLEEKKAFGDTYFGICDQERRRLFSTEARHKELYPDKPFLPGVIHKAVLIAQDGEDEEWAFSADIEESTEERGEPLYEGRFGVLDHLAPSDLFEIDRAAAKTKQPAAGRQIETFYNRALPSFLKTLKQVHEAGIAHLDIKPANILWDENGEVRLSDWDLAQEATTIPTMQFYGTSWFLPPECGEAYCHHSGHVRRWVNYDARSQRVTTLEGLQKIDVHQAGVTLALSALALTGKRFTGWQACDHKASLRQLKMRVHCCLQIPEKNKALFLRMLETSPTKRITAAEAYRSLPGVAIEEAGAVREEEHLSRLQIAS